MSEISRPIKIPETWTWIRLGHLADVITKGTTPTSVGYAFTDAGIRFIKIENIRGGRIDAEAVRNFISSDTNNALRRSQLQAGDVLFSIAGTIGACAVVTEDILPANTNQALAIIRGISEYVSIKFFRTVASSLLAAPLKEKARGGAMSNISLKDISEFEVPLPPLPEQKRIVAKIEELFSELEAGEASLRKARRQLGVYRQSLLKQAFEGKLTQKWRTQNPDKLESPATLLARIQSARQSRHEQLLEEWKAALQEWECTETEEKRPPKPKRLISVKERIPVFDSEPPVGWTTLNLSQFVLELGQGWSPKCENREAQDDEWSVIKTTAIQFGHFDPSANKALPSYLSPRRWLGLSAGEILITRAGPRSRCGVVCRVRGDHPRLMLCDKAYRLVLCESATSPEYVERLLCSPLAMAAIEKLKTGINDSGVNLTQSAFLQLALPIPSLPEQQEIVRILDAQFEVIEQNERELDAALKRSEALRQSILKKAFSGRLVPQDPTDESAAVLLERIRAEREMAAIKKTAKPTKSKERL